MKITFLLSILFFTAAINAKADCPNLSGHFACPAYGANQPASAMTVTQSETNGVTTYVYTFEDGAVGQSSANPAGMIDQEMLKFCDNQKLYLGNITGPQAGRIQIHFIDAHGDYVVMVNGKVIQDCVLKNSLRQ